MRISTLKGYLIAGVLALFMMTSLGSCKSNKTMAHGWTDLKHARQLDKRKGMRSKKLQKNVTRAEKH